MSKIEEYSKVKQNLRSLLKDISREDVLAEIRKHLAENNLHGVAWFQYVPAFNDGEACTFSVAEIWDFTKESLLAYGEDLDPNLLEENEGEYIKNCGIKDLARGNAAIQTETDPVPIDEDILERVFGHNVAIVVTQKSVYETDYYVD